MSRCPQRSVNVAMVQGNIPQSMKWDPQQLLTTLRVYTAYSKPFFGQSANHHLAGVGNYRSGE